MLRPSILLISLLSLVARAEPLEEWKPYAKTGLFPSGSPWWLAPDMEKEPIATFTARLLDGARSADTKAMATLGRFIPGKALLAPSNPQLSARSLKFLSYNVTLPRTHRHHTIHLSHPNMMTASERMDLEAPGGQPPRPSPFRSAEAHRWPLRCQTQGTTSQLRQ